jgi:cysteine-rich repeat protein
VCQVYNVPPITCPNGQFLNPASGCVPCPTGCTSCSSASVCRTCTTGYSLSANGLCTLTPVSVCGNGIIQPGETCDTGSVSSPGCINCQVQSGYTCNGQPSVCVLVPPALPALYQSGTTSVNSNNIYITLKTNPTFTFSSTSDMQNFIQSAFSNNPKPTVYCSQQAAPLLDTFNCLLIYPSGVPNSIFTITFSYNYQGRTGSTTVNVNPLTVTNARSNSNNRISV